MGFEAQTRNEHGEILRHASVNDAMLHAREDPSVWKISFDAANGERIRLVQKGRGTWVYEPLMPAVDAALREVGDHSDPHL